MHSREVVDAAAALRAAVAASFENSLRAYNLAVAALDIAGESDVDAVLGSFHEQTEVIARQMRGVFITRSVLKCPAERFVSWLALVAPTLVEGAGTDPGLALDLLRQEFCPHLGSGLSYPDLTAVEIALRQAAARCVTPAQV